MFSDGYALTMMVTLDQMGGTRAVETITSERGKELIELESYVDPEKFRVLFFDREDRFLFESKSRWVKKMIPNEDDEFSHWLVSVPLYDYGNDEDEGWNWEEIRKVLTGEDMDEDIARLNETNSYEGCHYHQSAIDEEKKATSEEEKREVTAFKIAILANRSNKEWNMGINGRYETGNSEIDVPGGEGKSNGDDILGDDGKPVAELTPGEWSIINGPKWSQTQTRWGDKDYPDNAKTVFDLHHCQYDPIYHGKSYNDRGYKFRGSISANDWNRGTWEEHGKYKNKKNNNVVEPLYFYNYHVYDFIAGEVTENELNEHCKIGDPTMGATSTWVDWSNDGKNYATINGKTTTYRYFLPPSQDHPIPMYGIQSFSRIDAAKWTKGTPFNLSTITQGQDKNVYNFKSISLLRSVVKLELVMPFSPDWAVIFYPNIYARCEPLNVWDPTNEIWEKNGDEHVQENGNVCQEWYDIRQYGAVTRNADSGYTSKDLDKEDDSVDRYKARMSWFYGAWNEYSPNGETYPWQGKLKYEADVTICQDNALPLPPYPQIFNSCVQRVGAAVCYQDIKTGKSYKTLSYVEPDGVHLVAYVGERNINDPSNITRMGVATSGGPTVCYWQVGYKGTMYSIGLAYNEENKVGAAAKTYRIVAGEIPNHNMGYNEDTNPNCYEQAVQNGDIKPWPLMRNHIYRIEMGYAENAEKPRDPNENNGQWGDFYLEPTARNDSDWPRVDNDDGTVKGWANRKELFTANIDTELTLSDGSVIPETAGIKFKVSTNADKRINWEYDVFDRSRYFLRLEKETEFTFPRLPIGSELTIVCKVPVVGNNSTDRYIELTGGDLLYNGQPAEIGTKYKVCGFKAPENDGKTTEATYKYTFTWKVNTSYERIKFKVSKEGGLGFEEFRVTTPSGSRFMGEEDSDEGAYTRGTQTVQPNFIMKTEDLYSKSIKFSRR